MKKNNNKTDSLRSYKKAVLLSLLGCAISLMLPIDALAFVPPGGPANTPMGIVLCTVINFVIYGNLGRGLATIAILIVGIGAMLGKVSWGLAITVGVGISVMFGAYDIGTMLGITANC